MPADPVTRRLLASASFTRCRAVAEVKVRQPVQLQTLLAEVELRAIECEAVRVQPLAVMIDIAAAVVEAFLESGADYDALDAARSARLRLVVAGLEYLVIDHDVIPDDQKHGMVDDLAVVRWVARVASGAEGHPVDELSEFDD
ncbi:hypothetical protein [Yimella sp. cx-51]|uniref:hypothetical protein n=1 Tax=Yimella sp. cx-51 TaxID=2770551 RepID=UPI00165D9E9D|nr:hypothetical protein [Yimella sp. cx-51]MBC9957870.1 hypothetical protein [Yimella sp. cx-51]QTH38004.1 hypothetical protein J5M86_14435 [Yimella sp. cx-51]